MPPPHHRMRRRTRVASSFDHLGGAQQNRSWYRKVKRLGGLEVHGHLEFCWKLHRKIARLRAAQNAIDIRGDATPDVYPVDSVVEQTAVSGEVRYGIDRRYVVSGCRRYNRHTMRGHEYIRY